MSSPQFEKLENFRDVASIVNTYQSQNLLKPGLLFRSARPDETTESDRELLVNHYRIQTIFDLRTTTEHVNAAKKRSELAVLAQPAVVPVPTSLLTASIKVPGINYAEINLNGRSFEKALLWKLSWTNMARFFTYLTLGYRMDAIGIIGREVIKPRGLIGLGIDTLIYSGQEIKELFGLLAKQETWPIMIHCTQGKDRTGLTVILVLLLCGVGLDAITADYVRTASQPTPNMDERWKEASSIGLDESFSKCPEDFPQRISEYIKEHYGSTHNYLLSVGVTENELLRVTAILQADQGS